MPLQPCCASPGAAVPLGLLQFYRVIPASLPASSADVTAASRHGDIASVVHCGLSLCSSLQMLVGM